MTSFFDKVTFTADDVTQAVEEAKARRTAAVAPDRRICICGHGARSHSSLGLSDNAKYLRARGIFKCSPGKVKCPCEEFRAVAITSDVRKFTSKTEGPGNLHALSKGATLALEKGCTVEWLEGVCCDRCKLPDKPFAPVAYSPSYVEVHMATPINRLVCEDCRVLTAQKAFAQSQAPQVAPEPVTS
jgi:uncharacterized cupin superfamily protein